MNNRPLTCDMCGFDGSRWSDDDLERTVAHADDLVGYVTAGWPGLDDEPGVLARTESDPIATAHAVMHRLDELAAQRRTSEPFAMMVGAVSSMQASAGGVPKLSISEATIGPSGIDVDGQNNRRNHGRPWQALCLYSAEVISELAAEGHPIAAGATGENITLSGIDWPRMRGGLTIEIGEVRLRTSSPATPCHKIGDCFAGREWDRIDHDDRPGWSRWYASVLAGGTIRPGDQATVSS